MAPFSKPETVLKQAEGLVSVGQAHAAIQSLSELFASKRARSVPLATLEPIMLRFVELCVDLRKGRTAKEGLMQYKNIAQNSSVGSIEVVVKRFLSLAEAKLASAQEEANQANAVVDVDDLEATETPESILLGAVSGEQSKDRTDRALVTPWLRFLWEAHRTALETLKNNTRLESIYQNVAQQAFIFCLKNQRQLEFRRLCDTLRLHLATVAKYAHQPHAINLADPETLQRHLETRFAQLNTSVELELWQEAFRSVEDIHNLLTLAKKAPRPAMMANYYEKLTRIFLTGGNALFHAAAWSRYYAVAAAQGKSDEELSKLAGQVLISALAVPVGQISEVQVEELKGKNARLTALLGLSKLPTRSGLLKECLSRNLPNLAPPAVRQLYDVLEVTFDPLSLFAAVSPILEMLSTEPDYAAYLPLLRHALLSRLLSQLAQVYSTVTLTHVLELVKPLGTYDLPQIESYVLRCARKGELRVRIDHRSETLHFLDNRDDDEMSPSTSSPTASTSTADLVQPFESVAARTRLSTLATALHTSLGTLFPPKQPSEAEQAEKLAALVAAAAAERKALKVRRSIVARRRELLRELSMRNEKEQASRRAEVSRKEQEDSSRKALEDARRREHERIRREIENVRVEEAKKLAQSLKERGNLKVDIDDVENLNTDNLMKLQVEQLEKEKSQFNERLRLVLKRIDHLERAYRKEERPLIAQDYERQQEDDRVSFEQAQKTRKEAAQKTHENDLATKQRLTRILPDYHVRREEILGKRKTEFEKRKADAQRKIDAEITKRRNAIIKEREEQQRKRDEEERLRREQEEEEERIRREQEEEEERKRTEEEAKQAAEAAERQAAIEKAAAEKKAREEQRAKDMEAVKRQQEREEAAERRAAERRKAPVARSTPTSVAPAVPEGGAWRRPSAVQASPTPPRTTSPPRSAYRPPASRGEAPSTPFSRGGKAGGGWRERQAARDQAPAAGATPPNGSATPPRASTPQMPATPQTPTKNEDDGFQTVPARTGVWQRGRGRGTDSSRGGRGGKW